ncbi:hypothetical protein [Streptomyces sp. MI02-7b]|uniref:hypothetical protein n=1 Tax=Streptomyces sp. MI02-7b TaxID=462941 RepID=UPI0029B91317|nr:hypothetical protein [Streptomyces sp. MI02-7b]MDX3074608.1 hypothetical protein [Streptomyces sp. MI02-7b]
MGGIDWGDAPTWVAGAFAAVAAYYARGTMKSQQKQIEEQRHFIAEQSLNLALERAQLSAAAEDRKWEQARQISMKAWIQGGRFDRATGQTEGPRVWSAEVLNGSPVAIWAIHLCFVPADQDAAGPGLEANPEGRFRHSLAASEKEYLFSAPAPLAVLERNRPVLHFRDDGGVEWALNEYGKLTEKSGDCQCPAAQV